MCKVIAVANQKGGVGKTVTCVNLGTGLARAGKRVLMIDADPQGSLTISLGYSEPDRICRIREITIMMRMILISQTSRSLRWTDSTWKAAQLNLSLWLL